MNKKIWCLSAALLAGSVVFAAPAAKTVKVVQKDTQAIDAAIKLFDSGDRAGAFILLSALENSGDLRILARLGMCYYGGQGVEKDLKKARQYFLKAEASPDGWGLYGMGICYHEGIEVVKDFKKAKEYFLAAHKKGVLYALGSMGFIALQENNPAEAKKYFLQEYNCEALPKFWRGMAAGMLGNMSDKVNEKISYWEKAALWGVVDYCSALANLYNSGKEMEVDPEKALKWAELYSVGKGDKSLYAAIAFEIAIEKMFLFDNKSAKKYMLLAADSGEEQALWYAFGFTNDIKYALAAADKGDVRVYNTAGAYLANNPKATAADKAKAMSYYQVASKLENDDSWHAICNMAALYAAAPSDPGNMQKAFDLYKSVADWYCPRGLRGVGVMHWLQAQSAAAAADKEKYSLLALEYTAAGAAAADEKAGDLLGDMIKKSHQYANTPQYKFAVGVNKIVQGARENRPAEFFAGAVEKIKEAASQGNIHAITALGICAQRGMNLKRDLNAAAGYFRKASSQGNLYAKQQLISGEFQGIVTDAEADALMKELIQKGDRSARHLYAMFEDMRGNRQNAINLFRENADAGFMPSAVEVYRLLSDSKDKKTYDEALEYLFKAIKQNNGQAQCILGGAFWQAPDATPRQAVTVMMKGVIDGAAYPEPFLRHLAYAYANGSGVKKSPENAKKLCEIMIGQELPAGYLTMGEMHQQGVFGKADIEKAREYLQKGAAMGDEACQQALQKLNTTDK